MFKTDNTIKVFIGKDIARTASVQINDSSNGTTYIADGEVLVLDATDRPSSALCEYIKIVQRSGSILHFSPRIRVANITNPVAKLYAAATEQIDYIGYNTTTGSITETDYNNYFVHITYMHDKEMWSEQLNRRIYHYYSPNSVTQKDVATTFTELINADQFTYGGYGAVKAEMLTNGTFTGIAQNVVVTQNSTYITFAGAVATLVVGDLIRLGGTTAASPVYEIKTVISTTVYELNTPYQSTSATLTANTQVGEMSAVTAYGIKLTGLALDWVAKGLKPYKKVFYNVSLVGFGSTIFTASTRMTPGNGVYQQVADMEWFALGGDGIRNFMWHPIPDGRTDAVSGTNYNVLSFEYTNTDESHVISGTKPARGLVYVFMPGTHAGANQMDSLVHTTTGELNVAIGNAALEWA